MRVNWLQSALNQLQVALREMQSALDEVREEPDPLASDIFVSRRHYRNMLDTKGGKRHETAAHLSWQTACELGFRGSLEEWRRLMGAVARP